MQEIADNGGFLLSIGEALGGFIAGIPSAIGSLFSGIGSGAGVSGPLDWILLVIGLSLLLSVIRGVKRGRIVGPAIRGLLGVALLGWAVS